MSSEIEHLVVESKQLLGNYAAELQPKRNLLHELIYQLGLYEADLNRQIADEMGMPALPRDSDLSDPVS